MAAMLAAKTRSPLIDVGLPGPFSHDIPSGVPSVIDQAEGVILESQVAGRVSNCGWRRQVWLRHGPHEQNMSVLNRLVAEAFARGYDADDSVLVITGLRPPVSDRLCNDRAKAEVAVVERPA